MILYEYSDEDQLKFDIAKNQADELYISLLVAYIKNISMDTPNRMAKAQEMVRRDKAYEAAVQKYTDLEMVSMPRKLIILDEGIKIPLDISE